MRRTGGLIGMAGVKRFMGNDSSSENVANYICYLVDLVGAQHVGIGLDYAFEVDVPAAKGIITRTRNIGDLAGLCRYQPLRLRVTGTGARRDRDPAATRHVRMGCALRAG